MPATFAVGNTVINIITYLILSSASQNTQDISVPQPVVVEEVEETEKTNFLIKNDSDVLLDVPFVNQIEDLPEEERYWGNTACGPAALTMALGYLGEDVELLEVVNKLPVSVYRKGDRFYNLYDGPTYFSKETVKMKNDMTEIFGALEAGNPIILNVQNYDGFIGHALVIVGIEGYNGTKANSLIIHDPYVGPYREFELLSSNTLRQPEGYVNTIGILDPFYVKDPDPELMLEYTRES